jgi:hypothetical protein
VPYVIERSMRKQAIAAGFDPDEPEADPPGEDHSGA